MRSLRGQITLEYMVLSLVALSLLAISISALARIQFSSSKALDSIMFRKSAYDLHSTIEEVCALGIGNQRAVHISRPMDVQKDDNSLKFSNKEIGDMSIDLICPFGINSSALTAGNIIVSNELNYNKNEIKIK